MSDSNKEIPKVPKVADFIDQRRDLLESEVIPHSELEDEQYKGVYQSQQRNLENKTEDPIQELIGKERHINTDRTRSRSRKRYQQKLDSEKEIEENLEEKRRRYKERKNYASQERPNKSNRRSKASSRKSSIDRDVSPGVFRSVELDQASQNEDQKYLEFLGMDKAEPSRKSVISEERRRELSNKLRRSQFEDKFDDVVNFKEFARRSSKKRKSEFFAESAYSDLSQLSKGEKSNQSKSIQLKSSLEHRRNKIKNYKRDYHSTRPKSMICNFIFFILYISPNLF